MYRLGALCLLVLSLFIGTAAAQSSTIDPLIFRSAPIEQNVACPFSLYSINPESGAVTAVPNMPTGNIAWAAWSPNGEQIAFFLDPQNLSCGPGIPFGSLYVMNADGSEQRVLVADRSILSWQWSPDGTQIVYEDAGDAGGMGPEALGLSNIVVIDSVSGAELKRWEGLGARWSPDGSHLVFTRKQPDHDLFVDLFVVNVNEGEPRQLLDWPGNVETYDWTPNSAQVTFMYYELPNNQVVADLYTVSRDGGEPVNLTNTGQGLSVFAYSPDGTMIAYEAREGDFYVMNADGSNQQRISVGPGLGRRSTYPAWSPDGSKVAFEFQPPAVNDLYSPYTLYILDIASGTVVTPDPAIGTEGGFVWTPDSQTVIYRGNKDMELEIYSVPADGSAPPRNISNKPGTFDINPMWRPGARG